MLPARSIRDRFSPRCGTECALRGAGALARDLFGEHIFQRFAILEIDGNVDVARHVGLANVELLEQGREEFAGVEVWLRKAFARLAGFSTDPKLRQLLPEKLPAVEDAAAAHVEQIHRQHLIFEVIAENIGVVAFRRGDALLFLQLFDGGDQIAILGGALEFLRLGGILPCARAAISPDRSGGLPGTTSRRAPLRDKSRAWSAPSRTVRGSA